MTSCIELTSLHFCWFLVSWASIDWREPEWRMGIGQLMHRTKHELLNDCCSADSILGSTSRVYHFKLFNQSERLAPVHLHYLTSRCPVTQMHDGIECSRFDWIFVPAPAQADYLSQICWSPRQLGHQMLGHFQCVSGNQPQPAAGSPVRCDNVRVWGSEGACEYIGRYQIH